MGAHLSHLSAAPVVATVMCGGCQALVAATGAGLLLVGAFAVGAAIEYFRAPPENDVRLPAIPENEKELEQKAQKTHPIDSENFYNFAFAGRAKTGKSSLINAGRGLRDDEEGAAAVDITECTTEMSEPFECPAIGGTVRLYDVPGCGTDKFTAEGDKYYLELGLRRFDCLIIMAEQTLGEDEIKLARLCKKYSRPCVFVRSKCDVDLSNRVKQRKIREENQEAAEELVKQLDGVYKEAMRRCGIAEVPIFFVSCYSMYDVMLSAITNTTIPEGTVIYQEAQLIAHLKEVTEQGRRQG